MTRQDPSKKEESHGPLIFTHVRNVPPDSDEPRDALEDDFFSLEEGYCSPEDAPPELADERDKEDDEGLSEEDGDFHEARTILSSVSAGCRTVMPDYMDRVQEPIPGDELLAVGGGSNRHRGVTCRRK